jgi:uncharacterized protein
LRIDKMEILPRLLTGLPNLPVLEVRIGLHWTAVVVDFGGRQQVGLAATLHEGHNHTREPDIQPAGGLTRMLSGELARWSLESHLLRASVGVAALNASLDRYPGNWQEANAEEVIATRGVDKKVVLVGHFPFVPDLKNRVGELVVLEQNPGAGDLPASAASEVIPQADVVAITGMALTNHTLDALLAYCRPDAFTMLLGPSTPLHPILFECGFDWLSGTEVTQIDPVLRAVSQGANFHQLRQAGVCLVNLARPGLE